MSLENFTLRDLSRDRVYDPVFAVPTTPASARPTSVTPLVLTSVTPPVLPTSITPNVLEQKSQAESSLDLFRFGSISTKTAISTNEKFPVHAFWAYRANIYAQVVDAMSRVPNTICHHDMKRILHRIKQLGKGSYGSVALEEYDTVSSSECVQKCPKQLIWVQLLGNPQFAKDSALFTIIHSEYIQQTNSDTFDTSIAVKEIPFSFFGSRMFYPEIIGSQLANFLLLTQSSPHFIWTYRVFLCGDDGDNNGNNATSDKPKQPVLSYDKKSNKIWMMQEYVDAKSLFKFAEGSKYHKMSHDKQRLFWWTIFCQQLQAIYSFNKTFHCCMGDVHSENWLIEEVDSSLISVYDMNDTQQLHIPTYGWNVRAIDIGFAELYSFSGNEHILKSHLNVGRTKEEKQGESTTSSSKHEKENLTSSNIIDQMVPDDLITSKYSNFANYTFDQVEELLIDSTPEAVAEFQKSTWHVQFIKNIHPCVKDLMQLILNLKYHSSPIFSTVWNWMIQKGAWNQIKQNHTYFPEQLYASFLLMCHDEQQRSALHSKVLTSLSNPVYWPKSFQVSPLTILTPNKPVSPWLTPAMDISQLIKCFFGQCHKITIF